MYLTRLSLTNYRAFTRLDLEFPGRIVLLVGANAQGKTSILEAIYYLATFSSFHAATDRQLINFTMPEESIMVARIVAEFKTQQKQHQLEVRLVKETNGANSPQRFRKEVLLDGVKRKIGDVLGKFNAVIFLPQMARIIEGAPADRRQYLNALLSQVIPHYARHLRGYGKVLSQRNALLKMLSERGGEASQLEVWDDMLAKHSAAIMKARIIAIRELEHISKRIHYRLTDSQEVLRFHYRPAFEPLPAPKGQLVLPVDTDVDRSALSIEDLQVGFIKALCNARREDISRGLTTLGPHRDELRILSNKIDLGNYGSRGQSRTALLAMKMAEVQWMREKTGEWPVLLLDEMLAELDPQRRHDLLEVLKDAEQALLTSTDLDMFEADFVAQHEVWHVDNGLVKK